MITSLGFAVAGVLLLSAAARLRAPVIGGAGLLVLAFAEALAILAVHGADRVLAAVPGAALLLGVGELCFGLADGIGGGPGDRRRQIGWVGGCVAAAAALAFVVLGADTVALRRSAVATVAGAALAALAVWLLVTAVYALAGEDD